METNIKDSTVFLEFYGLPGSGKSTISHIVAEELRKMGKNVEEPTYDIDHKYSGNIRKVIKLLKLVRSALLNPKEYKALCVLIKANGYTGIEVLSQAANIVPKLWEYDHTRSDYEIFDEGLTQSAISLVNNERNSSENEVSLYSLCKKRVVRKFYIKVSPETALLRMAGRDMHDSRIEKMTDDIKRNNALQGIEIQCESILDGYAVEEDSIQSAVDCIVGQLAKWRENEQVLSSS